MFNLILTPFRPPEGPRYLPGFKPPRCLDMKVFVLDKWRRPANRLDEQRFASVFIREDMRRFEHEVFTDSTEVFFFDTEKNHELRSLPVSKVWTLILKQPRMESYHPLGVFHDLFSGGNFLVDKSQLNSSSWKVPGSAQFIGVEANFVALSHGIWKILMLSIASIFVPWLSCRIFQMTWWYLGSRLNQEIWVNLRVKILCLT